MIRTATPDDFEPILDMCEEFWQHTQFYEPFERDHTRNMVQMCYDCGLLAVLDIDGPQGFMACVKSPLLGSTHAFMALELAWWINPKHRGKMQGVSLIRYIEQLAIKADVKYMNMAFMETSMPDRVKRMYESLGYTLQETVFSKVLDGSHNISGSCSRGNSLRGKEAV